MREIDADRMLFLDGNKYSTDFSMFTEPLPNTVYTAHDYVVAGLDPHGHYPGELDGRYPGSAKGMSTTRTRSMNSSCGVRPSCATSVCRSDGQFGPLYNGTPDQAEERTNYCRIWGHTYRDYQASWALWLYKDIGLQGLRPAAAAESPYMVLLKDFLAKKERLGADSWGGTDDHISALSSTRSSRCSPASFPTSTPTRGARRSGPRGCCVTSLSPRH